MRFGQMSIKNTSSSADYLQLDICGKKSDEAIAHYLNYKTFLPVILHGDWQKKGCSENNIKERLPEYIKIVNKLKKYTTIIGFTMHPPHRKKVPLDEFLNYCRILEDKTSIPVFVENRSNKKIWLSQIEEIIDFSKHHVMTIDIPQLYIASNYNFDTLLAVLDSLYWDNIRELHIANLKRINGRTFVARKINDGEIKYEDLAIYLKRVNNLTLEILGGINIFNEQIAEIKGLL